MGAAGPIAFFISSGFALSESASRSYFGWSAFAVKRFFRLAPLYIFILFISLFTSDYFIYFSKSDDLVIDFLARLAFLQFLSKNNINFDPTGVAWTIPYEFWWALLVPVFLLKKFGSAFAMGLTFIALTYLSTYSPNWWMSIGFDKVSSYKAITTVGVYFFLGFIVHKVYKKMRDKGFEIRWFSPMITIAGIAPLLLWVVFEKLDASLAVAMSTPLLLIAGLYIEFRFKHQVPTFLIFLGTICYGVYLWHPILFSTLKNVGLGEAPALFWIGLPFVLMFSCLTYVLIEVPAQKLVRKFKLRPAL